MEYFLRKISSGDIILFKGRSRKSPIAITYVIVQVLVLKLYCEKLYCERKVIFLRSSFRPYPLDLTPWSLWRPYPFRAHVSLGQCIALSNIVMVKGILSEESAKALLQEKSYLLEKSPWALSFGPYPLGLMGALSLE